MLNKIIVVFISFLLAACTTPKYNYTASSVFVSEPPVDTINVAMIGDSMLKQGRYNEHEVIYVFQSSDARWAYILHPGYYLRHGEDEDGEYFSPFVGEESGKIEKAVLADPWKSAMTRKRDSVLCIITVFNIAVCGESKSYDRRKKIIYNQNSFQQTLIYNGKIGNKINIGYREYSNNFARPAFNNNVDYDISESKIIGYKNARLEIIEATNQNIKYRVIKNYAD